MRWYKVQALKQAIAEQDTLTASLLVAERFCESMIPMDYHHRVGAIIDSVAYAIDHQLPDQQRFERLLEVFFRDLAFTGNEQDHFASKYGLLDKVIDYRTGIPVTLTILFCHIARRLGFQVSGVNFPGHFLIRYQLNEETPLFVDPLTGRYVDCAYLEQLYFSVVGETDEEEMPDDVLDAADTRDIVSRLLYNLKASFIREAHYAHALEAVELLLELHPDDPYERRDRGYLLHQLECPQVAMADYQFFIEQCPQDPSAHLLKLQLRKFTTQNHITLH